VLSVNDKTLVVVGYYGGYGGSFFANILRKSIDYNSPQFTPINDKNEYGFDTRVLGIERYTINTLMKAYDQGFDVLLNIKLFENTGNKEDAEFGKLVKRMYIDCYDNDRSKINLDKEAIVEYTNSNIKLLNNFLGIEIEDASFDDVKQAIKNKLKSLI
jgi:hypothetical protein